MQEPLYAVLKAMLTYGTYRHGNRTRHVHDKNTPIIGTE
ncbi:hypothetical protein SGL43_01098 [Streptomyces globisporus]|uniref:Uncharacterized protein n=1 Tax=Streptomyces globisporus TaxID=1908 RepID=A0ABM9GRQ3_STRGL|nr:hypothetical protein SGL43_01098 [Streptomyces globisporus]